MTAFNGIEIHPRVKEDAAALDALRGLPSSVIGDVMGGRLVGTTALRPVNRSLVSCCGNAFTVRVRAGDNLLIHKALDMLRAGDVLVVDGEGDISRALVGEIMMTTARMRGAAAFVMDGAIRDVDAFEAQRFPCWARGVSLRGPYKDGPGSINVPVAVGGMRVQPGDVIVGDSDGLVAVPVALAAEVAEKARAKVRDEQATIAAILAGTYSSAWVDATLSQKGV
ncbi:RraA family protein [Polaromonas sp. JS666]|uniref:RraA family protein n=1 Tax=Polaromonas sp. (strain JS666 / ATCC BAA-500) TaxID=296591 RepID=UPI000889BA07|nr:RraA family protein [Polaromonas sp. JS666]SDM43803.1 Regulator of RNase E activity RraA [Polaromonas sp. JS666]